MKDPCILLYTGDFLSVTALLSMRERGQFITLMCLQHQHGHLSIGEMRRAVGTLSETVLKLFEVDDEGNYYNLRTDEVIHQRRKFSEKQSQRAAKRWHNSGNAAALPVESEKGKEKGNNISRGEGMEEGGGDFDRFWAAYPRKKGKQDARRAWETVPDGLLETILAALERQRRNPQWQEDGGRFVPYPATWLRGRRWEDEQDAPAGAATCRDEPEEETNEMRAVRKLMEWKKMRDNGVEVSL